MPEVWEDGKYLVKMYIFGNIPFGKQWIVISLYDEEKRIRDNGYSHLIKKWDHNIHIKDICSDKTHYVDTIDIKAGILTIFVVLFANLFYRERQKRWRKLIHNQFNYDI